MAVKDIGNIIRLNGRKDIVGYLYALRCLYYLGLQDAVNAKADIDIAILENPDVAYNYLIRSLLHRALDSEHEELDLTDIDKAITLDPKLKEAYIMRAFFFRGKNKIAEACQSYRDALRNGIKKTKDGADYFCLGKEVKETPNLDFKLLFWPFKQNVKIPNLNRKDILN